MEWVKKWIVVDEMARLFNYSFVVFLFCLDESLLSHMFQFECAPSEKWFIFDKLCFLCVTSGWVGSEYLKSRFGWVGGLIFYWKFMSWSCIHTAFPSRQIREAKRGRASSLESVKHFKLHEPIERAL